MPRKSTTALAEPTPAESHLGFCETHGMTRELVARWWLKVSEMTKEEATDVTACWCCSAPAKQPGINAMTLQEIGRVKAFCRKCAPKEVTE